MKQEKKLTGYHALAMILTFFGVIFIANGFLIYFATNSWTGLHTENPYKKGMLYNEQLTASQEQVNRGWKVDIQKSMIEAKRARFALTASDKDETPISGMQFSLKLSRPTHEGMDRSFQLTENSGGYYTGETDIPAMGNWALEVTASRNDKIYYRSRNRIFLK